MVFNSAVLPARCDMLTTRKRGSGTDAAMAAVRPSSHPIRAGNRSGPRETAASAGSESGFRGHGRLVVGRRRPTSPGAADLPTETGATLARGNDERRRDEQQRVACVRVGDAGDEEPEQDIHGTVASIAAATGTTAFRLKAAAERRRRAGLGPRATPRVQRKHTTEGGSPTPPPERQRPRSCRLASRVPFGMEPRHLGSRCGRSRRKNGRPEFLPGKAAG